MRAPRRWLLVAPCALLACGPRGPTARVAMAPAGDHADDADGLLARASASLQTGSAGEDEAPADDSATEENGARYFTGGRLGVFGGQGYGALGYGNAAYGGARYAGDGPGSTWGGTPPPEGASYETADDLTGAVEGIVTWQGPPAHAQPACGTTLHVASDRGLGGALVYIEKIEVGRTPPTYSRAVTVGGTIVKHGCALLPAAQIVSPLPAQLTIYGDATATKLRATAPTGATRTLELQEGGQTHLDALDGVVRIDGDDGKLTPAWVVGVSTPYYAITDDAGRYRLDELAPGTYDVAFWQAPIGAVAPGGAITYGQPIVAHRRVTVSENRTAKLNVALGR